MLKIPRQQVLERWDSLTDNLREAICSEQNADILWRVCRVQHLSEDKIGTIATLAGDVIMGFTHAEDLAKEIKNELNLNPAIAESIVSEINRKIFSSIKAELDKVYAPVAAKEEVLDLRGKVEKPEPPVARPMPSVPEIIKPPVVSRVEPPVLSRAEVPKFTVGNRSEAGIIQNPTVIPVGESEPPPMIIHQQEAQIKPLKGTKKSLGGFFSFLRREKKENKPAPPVMAKVEIGGKSKIEPPKARPTSPPARLASQGEAGGASELAGGRVKVVHYSEFLQPFTPPSSSVSGAPPPFQPFSQPKAVQQSRPEPPENLPVVPSVQFGAGHMGPPMVSRIGEIPKQEIPQIKTPMGKIEKTILDLRKIAELKKPEPPVVSRVEPPKPILPKPPATNPTESPKPIPPKPPEPVKPGEEVIDLRSFK